MEISEAFTLLEKELEDMGMIDAWGEPQRPEWAFALMEKSTPDSEVLHEGLRQGLISAQEYYDHMLPLVLDFRIKYLAARSNRRIEKKLSATSQDVP